MARHPDNDNHLMTSIEDLYQQSEIIRTAPVTTAQPAADEHMPEVKLSRHNRMRLPILKSKPLSLLAQHRPEDSEDHINDLDTLVFSGLKAPLKERPVNLPDSAATIIGKQNSGFLKSSDLTPSDTPIPSETDPMQAIRKAVQDAGKTSSLTTPSDARGVEQHKRDIAHELSPAENDAHSGDLLKKLSALIEEEVEERLLVELKQTAQKTDVSVNKTKQKKAKQKTVTPKTAAPKATSAKSSPAQKKKKGK